MKKVLLTLLAVVLVLGLFAATGYAGYRLGFAQGVQVSVNDDDLQPRFRPFDDFGPRGMPRHEFGFGRGFGMRGVPMMGFGFFSPLLWLGRLAVIALVVGLIYWLFTRSGWQLTRTGQTIAAQPSTPEMTEKE